MVPDIALRIEVCRHTLTECLIPALDPGQTLAIEQAHVVVAHLNVIADQIDRVLHFRLADLKGAAALTQELVDLAAGGEAVTDAAREASAALEVAEPYLAVTLPDPAVLQELMLALKSAADRLLQASFTDGDETFRKRAARSVLDRALPTITRERVWTRKTGFDPLADSLPSMRDALR